MPAKMTKEEKKAKIQDKVRELFEERLMGEIPLSKELLFSGSEITAKQLKAKKKELEAAVKVLDKALGILQPAPKA
jgi:hypothetical protein